LPACLGRILLDRLCCLMGLADQLDHHAAGLGQSRGVAQHIPRMLRVGVSSGSDERWSAIEPDDVVAFGSEILVTRPSPTSSVRPSAIGTRSRKKRGA
jgi:hypothetical protein